MLPKIGTACYSLNTGRLDLQLVTTAAPVSKVKVSIRLARYREYAVCRPGAAVHQLRLYPLRLLFQAHPAQFADQPDEFVRLLPPPTQTTAPSRCTARATAVIAVLLVGRCKLVRYFTEASFGRLNHLRARGFYAGTKNAGTEFSLCAWPLLDTYSLALARYTSTCDFTAGAWSR